MRIFSFFLPQFHEIPENNEWWGKGFTEWTKLKTAEPLFKGHHQPQVPLHSNYYNLLEKETVMWQTELMHKYGVHGMVYYHYYFKGRLLLEKPAENLLKWKDINQPFFFCWANHSWRRTWEGKQTILIEQTYGTKNDWENHFQYLLPFFKDERYEKKDNCPLFMLFSPWFPEKKELFQYFDKRCKDSGFDGLYLVECTFGEAEKAKELVSNKPVEHYNMLLREPEYSKVKYYEFRERNKPILYWNAVKRKLFKIISNTQDKPTIFDGNALLLQKIKSYTNNTLFLQSICFSWDNTVRHGKRGYIITPIEKKMFMRYMDYIRNEPYCFINAWNEWAEGMVLEPTEREGYRYLEWIKEWSIKTQHSK